MPCWNTIKISYAEEDFNLPDQSMLVSAMKDMGLIVSQTSTALVFRGRFLNQSVNGVIANGKLQVQNNFVSQGTITALAKGIKQAYSEAAIKSAAARFKWRMTKSVTGKIQLSRR